MKFKICPHCKAHNDPTEDLCTACGADLFSVRVTDEETEKANAVPVAEAKTVRHCEECGYDNPANMRKCRQCGADISDVMPTACGQAKRYALVSPEGEEVLVLQEGSTVIGREETLDCYLKDKCYVSRRHAELTLENGLLSLLNLSHTNFTYVNNKRCVAETVELHDGDELGLGGNCRDGKRQQDAAYLTVRIE